MVSPVEWVKAHTVIAAAIGVVAVIGVGGTAAAVVGTTQADVIVAEPTSTDVPTSAPVEPSATPEEATVTEPGSTVEGGTTQDNTGQDSPTQEVAPQVTPEPAPAPPPPPAVPDAPTGVSIFSNGDGTFGVSWASANLNGATLAYYWVDVVNPAYTNGDRTTLSGTYLTLAPTPGRNCVVVAAVTTEGVTGNTAGPICTDLW